VGEVDEGLDVLEVGLGQFAHHGVVDHRDGRRDVGPGEYILDQVLPDASLVGFDVGDRPPSGKRVTPGDIRLADGEFRSERSDRGVGVGMITAEGVGRNHRRFASPCGAKIERDRRRRSARPIQLEAGFLRVQTHVEFDAIGLQPVVDQGPNSVIGSAGHGQL